MRFALHELHPNQFESLIVAICHELLGPGIQEFATGPDGGRDAKFVGFAQQFPSRTDPLRGVTIVQAKHTRDPVGKFSDATFSGTAISSTLSGEIPRIARLHAESVLDNYLLFANRRLGAIANESIIERIEKETGVSKVILLGVEAIERHVRRFPFLALQISEFEYALPLRASPDDLAEVITAIAKEQSNITWPRAGTPNSLERVTFERKNGINGLSAEYAELITKGYLKHFRPIKDFLADPINAFAYRSYCNAVDEFSAKLVAYKNDFEVYDKLLDYLLTTLIERDSDLRANKRLTRAVFYYMYWTCDIGSHCGENRSD